MEEKEAEIMGDIILIDDEGREIRMDRSKFKEWSRRVNSFYQRGSTLNLPGISRFDEPTGKWVKVLKRKLY